MSSDFIEIAASCNFLFKARCGAKDFLDKLSIPFAVVAKGMLFYAIAGSHARGARLTRRMMPAVIAGGKGWRRSFEKRSG